MGPWRIEHGDGLEGLLPPLTRPQVKVLQGGEDAVSLILDRGTLLLIDFERVGKSCVVTSF